MLLSSPFESSFIPRRPLTGIRRFPSRIALPWVLCTLFLAAPHEGRACACGCGIYEVGTSSMIPTGTGIETFFDYDYQDQNQQQQHVMRKKRHKNISSIASYNFVDMHI